MLVHICCSVDSHFFLEKLKEKYPQERLIGFFYDPNIHPYSEYKLRLLDVQRSCKRLGIELIEGEYDYENWLQAVRGLENEPEKGERCRVCFDRRLHVSAKKAKELGIKRYTTTLLVSPLKSQEQLKQSAIEVDSKLGTEFVFEDFRSFGGTQLQSRVTKKQKLYRQDYCGCLFGLSQQRAQQEVIMDEMISPLMRQILPASIEERLALYQKRIELEEQNISYTIVRKRFLNYRLLRGFVRINKEVVPSYILSYSHLRRNYARARVEEIIEGVGYANRDEIRIIDLKYLRNYMNVQSMKELYYRGIPWELEQKIRADIDGEWSLSPIVVLDKIPDKFEIAIDAVSYKDVKEKLIIKDKNA
ncbi:epoxyqueuosine reductase [Nitratiruptor sp. YY08-26]|uniref:epoxyqueuosine reductase QueH n=1 Tax=unclassified Nitratiruptor TaxID=2624044 RepID=UPI001916AC4A|nr:MULTISPECIES: epoxyqueuosine reductase QueH [unclassified Nitratiruptor]BCD61789.1 epoxyqueuosine reductase [Nitratiruptor sp. YY08-13]BCD65724.1 epoxyqueuosine reductase [Nitratiruptor sp. YY08-26]